MICAVAFVPAAPIVVPAVSLGAAHECEDLRRSAVAAVLDAVDGADSVVVLAAAAPGQPSGPLPVDAVGDLCGLGVDVSVALVPRRPRGPRSLPLPAVVGVWWCDEAKTGVPREAWVVASDADAAACDDLGWRLAVGDRRVALIVAGDGSAKRSEAAPGYVDPDAGPHDARTVDALAGVDLDLLLDADAVEAVRLMDDGRAARAVAAAAVRASSVPGVQLVGSVRYDAAPYGVGYVVATWLPMR